jgi:competence protein ComEC
VRQIARTAASIGGGVEVPTPSPVQLAVMAIAGVAFAVSPCRRGRLSVVAAAVGALLALEIVQIRAGAPRGRLRVTALDVGQGDSLLIDFPDGRSMLVDGGGMVGNPVDPGTRVILPVLGARRRSRVDVLALTHPHPDHFTGLATVAKSLPFGELWESGQGEMNHVGGPYAALLGTARERGAPVRRPADLCGQPRMFGDARVEVLAPCPRVDPATPANDASLVMRIDFGRRAALLVGDAERAAERALLASGAPLRADLLKVGHHGSRTSSSADFLQAVSPGYAMISCGVRNRFGHPHPDALARLAMTSARVLRTDIGGEIVWETDGDAVRILRPDSP